jgi:hypothetical protein
MLFTAQCTWTDLHYHCPSAIQDHPIIFKIMFSRCLPTFRSGVAPSLMTFTRINDVLNFSHVVRLSPLGTAATNWPIVPALDDKWWWLWSSQWNANWLWKPKYSEKTCPSATLSTTNPTWPDPNANPGHRGGKPETNRFSHGAAFPARSLPIYRRGSSNNLENYCSVDA